MWANDEPDYGEWCRQQQERREVIIYERNCGAEARLLNEREVAKWWHDGHVEYLRLQEAGGSPVLSRVLADGLIGVLLATHESAGAGHENAGQEVAVFVIQPI